MLTMHQVPGHHSGCPCHFGMEDLALSTISSFLMPVALGPVAEVAISWVRTAWEGQGAGPGQPGRGD
jgi:hypothetical protein